MYLRRMFTFGWLGFLLLLVGCSNGRGNLEEQSTTSPPNSTATPPPTSDTATTPPSGAMFSIGGAVNGLVGSGLVLQLNGSDDLTVTSSGVFLFAMRLPVGSQYAVTIKAPPSNPRQACTVANGSGTVASTDITSVQVTCGDGSTFSIGGTVSGLLGSELVLQNNGGNNITISGDGRFEFPTKLANGSRYNVTVQTHPLDPAQACSVGNGTGTIDAANITTVVVTCHMSEFTVGGTVSGLTSAGLVLLNNGDELSVDSNGSFTFPTVLPSGARYSVTIAAQPSNRNQTCAVSNGSGIVGSTNVTAVRVTCSSAGFRIGGHVSELRGSGLVLQNNGSDDLAIASNGSYRFVTTMPSGASYNVTVRTQPSDPLQTCTIKNGSGIVRGSDIQDVEVKCEGDDDDDDEEDRD